MRRRFIPSVIEPSFGIGRILYCMFEHSYYMREGSEEKAVFRSAYYSVLPWCYKGLLELFQAAPLDSTSSTERLRNGARALKVKIAQKLMLRVGAPTLVCSALPRLLRQRGQGLSFDSVQVQACSGAPEGSSVPTGAVKGSGRGCAEDIHKAAASGPRQHSRHHRCDDRLSITHTTVSAAT